MSFVWFTVAILGVLGGVGLLAVHISPSETTRVTAVFPFVRLFRHRPVRVVMAYLCFVIALVGVSRFIGNV